ncbi:MAG TPA: acylphosphatase [Fimbriimonadaceae bacterium]|nr:acylphosphatase [Fimbriimonadaceae bacterium]
MPTVAVEVRGRVQGVGFRMFVQELAGAMGVRGEVWNNRNGAVELVAQHEDPALLSSFIEALWKGPGRVDSVQPRELAEAPCEGFRVSWTR